MQAWPKIQCTIVITFYKVKRTTVNKRSFVVLNFYLSLFVMKFYMCLFCAFSFSFYVVSLGGHKLSPRIGWGIAGTVYKRSRHFWQPPSFICSCSIGHILEHEFFCFGRLGSQAVKTKSGFELFWATFEGGFFNFLRAKKGLSSKSSGDYIVSPNLCFLR